MAEFTLRPPLREEAGAIAVLINAHSVALNGGADLAPADIRQWFDNPAFDVQRDARVAVAPDGALVGYVDVGDPADRHTRYWIDLRLPLGADPAIGHALVDAMEGRARETAGEGARLRAVADSGDEAARALYAERGYELVRHSFRMRVDLDEPVQQPDWPEGIELHPFDPDRDARAVYEADTEAFRDHWEFSLTPYEEWEHWSLGRDGFDPTLWFVAREGDEIAGVALCRPHTAEESMGYVNDLAVRRPWRRRGLGLALLRHSFGEFARRGYRSVTLDVDAENLTGAVRLYERAGMRVDRRRDTLDRLLADEG